MFKVVWAPAKINLYLNILKKRSDGYHEVETVLQLVDLCDKIRLKEIREGITLSSDNSALPRDGSNFAYRAAELLIGELKIKRGVEIHIDKHIPVASGLGGGSSDAAAVLTGLNELWRLGLTKIELVELGKKVGTDVPFFIWGHTTALGFGRGEEALRLEAMPRWYVLVNPGLEISTKEIYSDWKASPTQRDKDITLFISTLKGKSTGTLTSTSKLSDLLYNSLEQLASARYPVLLEIKRELKDLGVKGVLMSGSGSTVFGILENRKEGMKIKSRLCRRRKEWEVIVNRTLEVN